MEKNFYDLTEPQKSIWLTEQYCKNTSISDVCGSLFLKEKVDFDLLTKAIYLFVSHNDSLRLKLKLKNGIPSQYLDEFVPFKIEKINVSSEKDLQTLENEMSHHLFKLENSFLFHFCFFEFPDQSGGFIVCLHHLICDAWSMSLLADQIVTFYRNLLDSNCENTKYENEPSYIDYIHSEKEYFNSNSYIKDKEFWENTFSSVPSLSSFSNNPQKTTSTLANRKTFELENTKNILSFCKENSVSPFSFFMSIYSLYLHKISNIDDIIIGSPLLNRKGIKEKNTIGMFINTLPIKISFANQLSFSNLMKLVTSTHFSVFKHHKYSYTELLKFVREKYKISNNLYDVIISYQNTRDNAKNSSIPYETNWTFCGHISDSLDIHIYDTDDTGILKICYDYQLEKFTSEEINAIHHRIEYMMEQVLKTPNISIHDIEIVPPKEIELLNSFNNTYMDYPTKNNTLIELFEKQVKLTPNRTALKFKDKELSYQSLFYKVLKLANHLRTLGVTNNVPVCLLVDRSLEMVIAMLATLKAGGYYIAIDPYWPNDRIKYIIENSDSNILITSSKYVSNYENDFHCVIVENIPHFNDETYFTTNTTPEDLAYILYTSGSTGNPKGTLITNKNVVGLLNATYQNFHQTDKDIWTLFHTYTFDFSTWEIYGSLLYGSKLIIVPKEVTINPREFLKLVIEEKVTILNQTPAYFYKVIEQEKILNPQNLSVRYVILGGEAVQSTPLKYWKNKYPNIILYNGYGPTETTVFAIMCELTSDDINSDNIYIGYPISNYQIHILDKNLKMLPIGYDGEICISGVGVCNGYFKKDDLTKEKFIDTPYGHLYKSGDVGHFEQNGKIKYLGRNDNQIKIRGFRIELEEIEKQISLCSGVSKVAVIPVENKNYTKSLVGFFVSSIPNSTEFVTEEIRKHLTSYMIPKLYQVDDFPLNNNGKVDIKSLLNSVQYFNTSHKLVAPANEVEEDILSCLKTIVDINSISTEDDFFDDLGLDSLNIMELSTKLSKYNVEIQDINNCSSIQKLAKKILSHSEEIDNHLQPDVKIIDKDFKFNLQHVLLTGVTGFLGSHILYELLNCPSVAKIYCLIRKKDMISAEERFQNMIERYFSCFNIASLVHDKVVIIDGNFEKNHLGLDEKTYHNLCNTITTVIHSGANVRHYGKYEVFYKANVLATKNMIQFCQDSQASLAHISTVSVGGYCKISDQKSLSEYDINIQQNFKNHVYMITKYEAECLILKELSAGNINAKIFRLGNIMPRLSDGKFQINMHQNGFLSRLKTIVDTKAITKRINDINIDLSPVDLCAKAILTILKSPNKQTIYHICNDHLISMEDLTKASHINIFVVDDNTCINLIKEQNNPLSGHLINDIILKDYTETPTNNIRTIQLLHELNFHWNEIDQTYLRNLYNLISYI